MRIHRVTIFLPSCARYLLTLATLPLFLATVVSAQADLPASTPICPPDYPVVFSADFVTTAEGWKARAGSEWKHEPTGGGQLKLVKSGEMGGFRAPKAWTVREDQKPEGSFVLTARARCLTTPKTPGRDILLILGWNGPLDYHYVHFAAENSPVRNVVMEVKPTGRTLLPHAIQPSPKLTKTDWQTVRVWYDRPSGMLRCFVDDMEKPMMAVAIKDLPVGAIGIGSFDDLADFDSVSLQAEKPFP